MDNKELEETIDSLNKKKNQLEFDWRNQNSNKYKLTHRSNGKNNHLVYWIVFAIVGYAFIACAYYGVIQNSIEGPQLQSDHIYSSPNGNWAGYPYQMIQHNDTYGTRFYSPVDGIYIGWMDNNHAAVNETR